MLWILIFDTLLLCTAENSLVNDLDWNQQSGFAVSKQTLISCPVEAVQILLKPLEQCNYNATWFSWPHRPAVLYNFLCWLLFFGLLWIKSHLGDSNYTYKKHLSVVESAFTFSFSPILQLSQYHRPSARSKPSNSLHCKNAPVLSSQVRSRR